MKTKRSLWKRVTSFLLTLVMVFSVVSGIPGLGSIWAKAAEDLVVHYKNTDNWSEVSGYAWIEGSGELLGGWPGKPINSNANNSDWYDLTLEGMVGTQVNFIFNNNNNNGSQTADLANYRSNKYDANIESNVSVDAKELWVEGNTVTARVPANWKTEPTSDSPEVHGNDVTFRYYGPNMSAVKVLGSMNGWAEPGYIMTKDENDIWSVTVSDIDEGTYKYKFVVNNANWVSDPNNITNNDVTLDNEFTIESVEDEPVYDSDRYLVVEYTRADNNYDNMKLWAWKDGADGADYDFEQVGDKYIAKVPVQDSKEDLKYGFIVKRGAGWDGAVRDEYLEKQDNYVIIPADQRVVKVDFADGKATYEYPYNTGTDVEDGRLSFYYREDSMYLADTLASLTDKVKVAVTSSLDADPTLYDMTYDAVNDRYSYEMSYTAGTEYYYYYLVNDKVVLDAFNAEETVTSGDREYNKLVVKEAQTDNNTVTIKMHYTREDGDYSKWDAWMWSDKISSKGYKFEQTGDEYIATMSGINGRLETEVTYILRKGDWEAQEDKRYIDLKNVVAGTVHVYVTHGSTVTDRIDYSEAVIDQKVIEAVYDRDTNAVILNTSLPIIGDRSSQLQIANSSNQSIAVNQVIGSCGAYMILLETDLTSLENVVKSYQITYDGYTYSIEMPSLYSVKEFEDEYTYTGDDLGAAWTETATTFKVWAPTADSVKVKLYKTGTVGENDAPDNFPNNVIAMTKGEKGVWTAVVDGNLDKVYYTYLVDVDGETNEACDPYARTTGVNGKRAMVLDLDSTDPEGWENDKGPNDGMNYTDAIIYELHVRDASIEDSSGVSEENQGKYLGLTETGTKVTDEDGKESDKSTVLDHIADLGVTHVHLLPVYDYGSVDETKLNEAQFNWGYDPVNYNVPEGSYSTDPYNGEVRVTEMKEMIQALHEKGINVIMDVVYNHVQDAGTFCFNQIVPDYFSRMNEDGSYSNASGCGNDTATERDMVRKYIVDSVKYWAEEYHFDGFRFDLVGLVDTVTLNEVIEEVHATVDEDIIFYGEGWVMDPAMSKDVPLSNQWNSELTPYMAYFSDGMRNSLAWDNNLSGNGYISGTSGTASTIENYLLAKNGWTSVPTRVVNYASCHDNYTLKDKIDVKYKNAADQEKIQRNNLAAAVYMMSEGISFIHAGEEFLRTKVDENGEIIHNSYKSSDLVNSLKWDEREENDAVVEYYKGLIEFRKNHEALRLTTAEEVKSVVKSWTVDNEIVLLNYDGSKVPGEASENIVLIFNPTNSKKTIDLSSLTYGTASFGFVKGTYSVCIKGDQAGTEVLATLDLSQNTSVTIPAISCLALVKGDTVDTDSVYINNEGKTDEVLVRAHAVDQDGNTLGENPTINDSADGHAWILKDTQVTVTAKEMKHYTFLGWYQKSDLKNALTTEKSYTFTVTEAMGKEYELVALYEEDTIAYTVYYHDTDASHMSVDAADLYVWDVDDGEHHAFAFESIETLAGKQWLKATFTMKTSDIGLIPRSKGGWTWQIKPDYLYSDEEGAENITLYITNVSSVVYTELPDMTNLTVSADVYYDQMDYNDNNVVTLKLNGISDNLIASEIIASASIDLQALGLGVMNIDTELMEVTIGVTNTTATGLKTLPVTVKDIFGKVYEAEAEVEVVKRDADVFDWDEAVIYMTITDRFFDGDETNNDGVDKEGYQTYHGGDFAGLEEKLDYLQNLGVNTVWITPIVENDVAVTNEYDGSTIDVEGYHGYWASDFTKLNSHLGTEEELQSLIHALHERGMKLMVDVVLNHAGYETEDYFNSVISGKDMIRENPTDMSENEQLASLSGLPDFVTEDDEVRNQLIEWQVNWMEKFDIDFYRVDTVKHVESTTWAEFKNELTKVDADFKLIGEHYDASYTWTGGSLGTGTMDSLLDFSMNDQALSFVTGDLSSVDKFLVSRNEAMNNTATYGAFLSSHDEDSLVDKLIAAGKTEKEALALAKVAASLQITAKGQTVIYYGEEIGQHGTEDYPVQTNRQDFDWDEAESQANDANSMLAHYTKLLDIREEYKELFARADRERILVNNNEGWYVFKRTYEDTELYFAFNIKDQARTITFDDENLSKYAVVKDLYSGKNYTVDAQSKLTIQIPAAQDGGTVILIKEKNTTVVSAAAQSVTDSAVLEEAAPTISGSTTVGKGDVVTATAQAIENYNFIGWYQKGDLNTVLSSKMAYTFTVTDEILNNSAYELVALYEPIPQVTVIVNADNYTVNGTAYTEEQTSTYTQGTSVTVEYTGTNDFEYWTNAQGVILSREKAYTFKTVTNVKLTAVVKTAEKVVVFESAYGQIMSRLVVPEEILEKKETFIEWFNSDKVPVIPVRTGWGAGKWNMTAEEVYKALTAGDGTEIITVTPVYEPLVEKARVTVIDGTIQGTNDTSAVYVLNTIVTLTANAAPEGQKFSHWADEAGTVLSYNEVYGFYLAKDVTIKAVFVEDGTVVEAVGTAEIISVEKKAGVKGISFVALFSVPDDCKIDYAGIVATSDDAKAQNLTAQNADYVRGGAQTAKMGRYTWTKSNAGNKVWYVKAYLVYTDSKGVQHTMYGTLTSANYASMK